MSREGEFCEHCRIRMVRREDWDLPYHWYWLECPRCGGTADLPSDEQEYLDYWDSRTGRPRRW